MESTNPEAAAGSPAAPAASWLEQYYTPEKGGGDAADEAMPALSRGAPGKYTILEPLAEGGMKAILRARDTDTGRVVALARIRGVPGARAVRRFIYEARLVAGLQHPNIVPIHDLGVDAEGRPFFTMRLVAGESLADILKKLRAGLPGYAAAHPRAELLSVFNRVCEAVAFAHARGVLHLDLKPSNIHVGKFGEVLVLDWGLAKLLDGGDATESSGGDLAALEGDREATLHGTVKGSPGFMAPEQAAGNTSAKDERTDVYALGGLLYALLTWHSPAQGRTLEQVLAETLGGRIVPPRRRAPARRIPRGLEAIAMRALERDPDRRYPSVLALTQDLATYRAGRAPVALEAGRLLEAWFLLKRNGRVAGLAVTALAVIATVLAVASVRLRASEQVTSAALERARDSASLALDALRRFRAEQTEKHKLGVLAGPRVVQKAEALLEDFRFAEALESAELASALDSGLPDAWMLQAHLHLAALDPARALAALARVPAESRAAHPEWRTEAVEDVARLHGERIGATGPVPRKEAWDFVGAFLGTLEKEKVRRSDALVGLLFRSLAARAESREAHVQTVGDAIHQIARRSTLDPAFEATEGPDGLAILLRGGKSIDSTCLAALSGLPITSLDVGKTGVSDLTALRDLPLRMLDLSFTDWVSDLTPLHDLPLDLLNVNGCQRISSNMLRAMRNTRAFIVSNNKQVPGPAAD